MNEFERCKQIHRDYGVKDSEEYRRLHKSLMAEERHEALKELGDLLVVQLGYQVSGGCAGITGTIRAISALGADSEEVLKRVNDSNESEFCRTMGEIDGALDHFESLGLKIYIHNGLVKSFEDQAINGKFYKKDKVLKPPHYKEADIEGL